LKIINSIWKEYREYKEYNVYIVRFYRAFIAIKKGGNMKKLVALIITVLLLAACSSSGGSGSGNLDSDTLINTGYLSNESGILMSTENYSTIINEGELSTVLGTGMYVSGSGNSGINNGAIIVGSLEPYEEWGNGGIGMYAENGGSIRNSSSGIINIGGDTGYGMFVSGIGSTAVNEGDINVDSDNSIAMKVVNGGTAVNASTGIINLNGSSGIGMHAEGINSTIKNYGTINLSGIEVIPGYSTDEEYASITGFVNNGIDSKGNIGMKIENGAKMINRGQIIFEQSNINVRTNPEGSTITVTESETAGMEYLSTDDEIINDGIILVEADEAVGIYSEFDNSTITNNGEITVDGAYSGGIILDGSASNGINNNLITVNVNYSVGIGVFANSVGINNGEIIVNSIWIYGMIADSGGTIINEGTINISGEISDAMDAYDGATAINNGTINLNASYGVGMAGIGTGTTIENNGTIYLSGTEDEPGYSTDEEYVPISDYIFNGIDSKNNIGMAIEDGAIMINRGQIIFGN
jgi:hypothetical protein